MMSMKRIGWGGLAAAALVLGLQMLGPVTTLRVFSGLMGPGIASAELPANWFDMTPQERLEYMESRTGSIEGQAKINFDAKQARFPPQQYLDATERNLPGWQQYMLANYFGPEGLAASNHAPGSALGIWEKQAADASAALEIFCASFDEPLEGFLRKYTRFIEGALERQFPDHADLLHARGEKETRLEVWDRYVSFLTALDVEVPEGIYEDLRQLGDASFAMGIVYFDFGHPELAAPHFATAYRAGYSHEGIYGSPGLSYTMRQEANENYRRCTTIVNALTQEWDGRPPLQHDVVRAHDGAIIFDVYYDVDSDIVADVLGRKSEIARLFARTLRFWHGFNPDHIRDLKMVILQQQDPRRHAIYQAVSGSRNQLGTNYFHLNSFLLFLNDDHLSYSPNSLAKHIGWVHEVNRRVTNRMIKPPLQEGLAQMIVYHVNDNGFDILTRLIGSVEADVRRRRSPRPYQEVRDSDFGDEADGIHYTYAALYSQHLMAAYGIGFIHRLCDSDNRVVIARESDAIMEEQMGCTFEQAWDDCFAPGWQDRAVRAWHIVNEQMNN